MVRLALLVYLGHSFEHLMAKIDYIPIIVALSSILIGPLAFLKSLSIAPILSLRWGELPRGGLVISWCISTFTTAMTLVHV